MCLKIRTQILTEQVLLQWFWPVQVHVVFLKDVLEQLRPLCEAAEQVQTCEMNYQLRGDPSVPTRPPERVRLKQKTIWEICSLLILSYPLFSDSKWGFKYLDRYFRGHFPLQLRRVLSPFLEPQPISGLLFTWAQNRAGWHKHIKLGHADSFLPAWGHNSWDIYLSQCRWKPGSFRGKTTYTLSQDRIQWSSVQKSGRLWPRTTQRISPDKSFFGWELFSPKWKYPYCFFPMIFDHGKTFIKHSKSETDLMIPNFRNNPS